MLCGMYAHLLAPTNCVSSGFTGCCVSDNRTDCKAPAGNCYCDEKCYEEGNCCDDIYAIGCKLWLNSKIVDNRVVIFIRGRFVVKEILFYN